MPKSSITRLFAGAVALAAILAVPNTAAAQPIKSPVKIPQGLPAPPRVLPGLSQLDPNARGTVANQNMNNGLNYVKDRYHKVPPPQESGLTVVKSPHIDPDTGAVWSGSGSTAQKEDVVARAELYRTVNGRWEWRSSYSNIWGRPVPVMASDRVQQQQNAAAQAPAVRPPAVVGPAVRPPAVVGPAVVIPPQQQSSISLEYIGPANDGSGQSFFRIVRDGVRTAETVRR